MTNRLVLPIWLAASFFLLVVILDPTTTRSGIPFSGVQGFTHHPHHHHLASTTTTTMSTTTQLFVGRRGGKAVPKSELPSKVCVVCGRPFTWRKKWERCWDEVTTCSKSCNGKRRSGGAAAARTDATIP